MDGLSESRINQLKTEFSLDDLQRLKIYTYFVSSNEKYTETNENKFLSISFEDQVKILEFYENGIGQKLGHDPHSETWFYEKWYNNYYAKSWKQGSLQWGESELKEPSFTTIEKWSWSPEEVWYEHAHLEQNKDYGSKSGRKKDISWREIWHKNSKDSALDKYWISATAKWGEKEGKIGKKNWGQKWRKENDFYEESSWNEEDDRKWGHVKGNNKEREWHEHWSTSPGKKENDKWWADDSRKWGIKSIIEGLKSYYEEWEEKASSKIITKVYDDGFGHKISITEGYGPHYKFIEKYKHNVETNYHKIVKKGFSSDGQWESKRTQQETKHFVHNKGENEDGSWEEMWEEDGNRKKAWKRGNGLLSGSWEEEWEENGQVFFCKKWGEKDEKWTEQWREEPGKKYCRKEQIKDGKVFLQEWEETFDQDKKHSFGKFFENGVVVNEWDTITHILVGENDN